MHRLVTAMYCRQGCVLGAFVGAERNCKAMCIHFSPQYTESVNFGINIFDLSVFLGFPSLPLPSPPQPHNPPPVALPPSPSTHPPHAYVTKALNNCYNQWFQLLSLVSDNWMWCTVWRWHCHYVTVSPSLLMWRTVSDSVTVTLNVK